MDAALALHKRRFQQTLYRRFASYQSQMEDKSLKKPMLCDFSMPLEMLPVPLLQLAQVVQVAGGEVVEFDIQDVGTMDCLW